MATDREAVMLELDAAVAAKLREHAAAEHVSESEIVERALRIQSFNALLDRIHERSDLDEDAAMKLATEELRAARDERNSRAA